MFKRLFEKFGDVSGKRHNVAGVSGVTGSDVPPLPPVQQAALEQSLRDALRETTTVSSSPAASRFNADVLACLHSGDRTQPASRQIITRLRWMALPAAIGFVLMYGLSGVWARTFCAPPAAPVYVAQDTDAPALPPLPTVPPDTRLAPAVVTSVRQGGATDASALPAPLRILPTTRGAAANVKGAGHVH